jgi:hypothetical protein
MYDSHRDFPILDPTSNELWERYTREFVASPQAQAMARSIQDAGWDGVGIPPEGTAPSTPAEGEVVAHSLEPYGPIFVYVYADGRVITQERSYGFLTERRLTPEGTALVQSGDLQAQDLLGSGYDVPADAWEDPEIKPFVPSRYAVCYYTEQGSTRYDVAGYEDPSRVVGFFPAPARDILRGQLTNGAVGTGDLYPQVCSEVTTEEARALDEILGWTPMPGGPMSTGGVQVEDSDGNEISWELQAILPHGVAVGYCSPNPCG